MTIIQMPLSKGMRLVMTFGQFLKSEMQKRDMNVSQFAEFVGVSHQTIGRYLEYPENGAGYPEMKVLVKLSKTLNIDLGNLVAMIEPSQARISPSVLMLAEQISKLPVETQDLIKALIVGLGVTKGSDQEANSR